MKSKPALTKSSAVKAIGWGGLLSGTFDLTFAFIYYGQHGATIQGVLHSIAAGALGQPAARQGGVTTATLGFALHYLISFGAASVYYAASRRLSLLTRHAIASGLLYGAGVYFFMNMVVLPLSAYHSRPFPPPLIPATIMAHLFCVGLPIALSVRKYAS